MIGYAMRVRHYLPFNFSPLVWKLIAGAGSEELELSDLDGIDFHQSQAIRRIANRINQVMVQSEFKNNDDDDDTVITGLDEFGGISGIDDDLPVVGDDAVSKLDLIQTNVGDVVKIANIGSGGWLLLEKIDEQENVDYTVNFKKFADAP